MGIKLISKSETEIKFSDMYALEFINWGLIHESVLSNPGGCLMRHETEVIVFLVLSDLVINLSIFGLSVIMLKVRFFIFIDADVPFHSARCPKI